MKTIFRRYLLSSIGFVSCLALVFWVFPEGDLVIASEKWKGVCWVGGRVPLLGGELQALKATGANAISQTPFGWQREVSKPEINWELESDQKWWGESTQGLRATFDSSSQHGMMNMLKPHIWVRGSWPGEIQMQNEADWEIWFENYTAFILDYARFAEELKFPVLCIGTELEKTSNREREWRKIIAEIRKVYSGKLTYAANFTEYEQVDFWDDLDYIGIQAYFPLSKNHHPEIEELKTAWEIHLPKIEKVVRKYQRAVLFTEIGYCNTADAAIQPWIWPNERKNVLFSEEIQARCYQAFFETAWDKSWMAGVFFWKWYPVRNLREPDFSPQGKKAEQIMARFFLTAENQLIDC
jgi:hypothetical protein